MRHPASLENRRGRKLRDIEDDPQNLPTFLSAAWLVRNIRAKARETSRPTGLDLPMVNRLHVERRTERLAPWRIALAADTWYNVNMGQENRRVNLRVYYDRDSAKLVRKVVEDLAQTYPFLVVAEGEEINPGGNALNLDRRQLDGDYLLDQLHAAHGPGLALWLVSDDTYHDGLNFVFGLAVDREAVVSTYRLDSEELAAKEAIHEIGHLLGLAHCRQTCVMRFSNSLVEAKHKPKTLCTRCRQQLRA